MADVIVKGVRTTDGRKVQLSGADAAVRSNLTSIVANEKGAANGLAELDGSSLVVQNPASADVTATANSIPIRDINGDVIVSTTPTSAGSATSKQYVDNQVTLGRSWKELLLVPEQLVAGGSGGICEAFVVALGADLAAADTFVLADGSTTETFTAVGAAPAAFEFIAGGGIAATTTNLVATINADSTVWSAVETTGLDAYFSGSNDPQIVIYRTVPANFNADRCYGTIAGGQAGIQVISFNANPLDYASTNTSQADLPSSDPSTDYSGFGRAFGALFGGETHRTVDNSASYTWDSDDQVWQKTSAGDVLDGAGLSFTGSTLNVGDINRGIQVNANDLELDASEVAAASGGLKAGGNSWQLTIEPADFAGTGLEDDGADNLRLATQGTGIAGGGGSTLSFDAAAVDGDGLTGTGSTLAVQPNTADGGGVPGLEAAANGVRIATTAAGDGLTGGGGAALSVQPNNTDGGGVSGLETAANGVRIATSAAGTGLSGGGGAALSTDVIVPVWTKYTVAATAFTAAATTEDIELLSLPAQGTIHRVVIKHTTAFSGGTSTAVTLSVGISGNFTKYAAAFDVFQVTGDTVFGFNDLPGMENFGAATSIRVQAIATGDNLVNVTTGSADIWVLASELPA